MHHFTSYIYDRRGRGDSTDTKPYAVAREIEDLDAIIERAGGAAYVYGVSAGAALALHAAAELGPERVTKLALYEPPYGQDEREFDALKDGVNERVNHGKPGDAAAFFLASIGLPPEAVEEMKASPNWQSIQEMDFTLAYDYAILGNGQVPDSVKAIRVPTLVMDGEKSMPFMRPTADRIAELVPNAERRTLEGQTHQAEPAVVAPLLIEFFKDESSDARSSAVP
jgi:pimeloyl-ACP methyl ester carboxylesterase